jgi:hypothetical protein
MSSSASAGIVASALEAQPGAELAATHDLVLRLEDRVPVLRVAHELDERRELRGGRLREHRERHAARRQVRRVLHRPVGKGAALALVLERLTQVPHVLVDDQLLAALEQVEQRGRPVRSDDGGPGVDLGHRQPTPGRRDRVALVGVRLLAYQQLVAGGLPRLLADDGRDGGGRLGGARRLGVALVGGGHGALLVRSQLFQEC